MVLGRENNIVKALIERGNIIEKQSRRRLSYQSTTWAYQDLLEKIRASKSDPEHDLRHARHISASTRTFELDHRPEESRLP
jgi:hypothetical protein